MSGANHNDVDQILLITSALNLAASNNAIMEDITLCEEHVMIEKQHYEVTTLDDMNQKVHNIAVQINKLAHVQLTMSAKWRNT